MLKLDSKLKKESWKQAIFPFWDVKDEVAEVVSMANGAAGCLHVVKSKELEL